MFCASRRYVHDASAPLHPLPRHHASRKKVIVEQTLEVRGDQDDEQVQLGSIGAYDPHSSPRSRKPHICGSGGLAVHMTTEQILPLIVVTIIFIDISEL